MRKSARAVSAVLPWVLSASFPLSALAADTCKEPAGRLASIEGQVQVQTGAQPGWQPAKPEQVLCRGDSIRVGKSARAAVVLANEAVMRLDQNTTIRLLEISGRKEDRSFVELVKGALQSFSRKPRLMSVNTPYLNGSIEGTEFEVRVDGEQSSILVLEGRVVAANERGSVALKPGDQAATRAGDAPTVRTLVKPRDSVQWSLHYPQILAAGGEANSPLERAAQLLAVGRQDEALPELDAALAREPQSGLAYALRAVVHVVRNERSLALEAAEKGVALSDTPATRIALSYAQQADFRIEAARDTLLAAVERSPDDALAWARLSELQLMLGDKERARRSAGKAAALAPDLARAQLVLGFASLSEYRGDAAGAAFRRAIELDPSDPMARLGLGLAHISRGELQAGRAELELAVALDPNQALLRAYLGKAYFEERRDTLDDQQFDIAKSLDPLDPTAFLYDGIRKQTANRPIDALTDLETSAALNDQRAVYRSRLLLDKDQAARGTSVARVYNDLGFPDLGAVEASRSLALDPADASAHRFLSDVHQNTRRREIARVSELTQAMMLQDLNINPVQPSTSETNLNIVTSGGPAGAGFNEFTPLFQRNQAQLSASAQAGSNGTRGGEAVVSGLYDRYSFSLGALNYETDGWRRNNGLEQDVYTAFAQAALTDQLNVQAEYRHRQSSEGDLAFNFDPDDLVASRRIGRKQETTRIGLRYSPAPPTHLLLSYIHGTREENLSEIIDLPPIFGTTTSTNRQRSRSKSDQVEAQLLHAMDVSNLVVGAAWSKSRRTDNVDLSIDDSILGNLLAISGQEQFPTRHQRGYTYVNLKPHSSVVWTLGASYDNFEQDSFQDRRLNPKFGVQWDMNPVLRLRAAAFQVVKPALAGNRTLEPTQIAGFNQLFDDLNGTRSKRYGVGLDWRAHQQVRTGIEFTHRDMDEPLLDALAGAWITEARSEQLHRIYADWTITSRLALHTELAYDRYRSERGIATADSNLPESVVTWSAPVRLSYFAPSGWFAGLSATYVDQAVRRSLTATQASGNDQFVVVDTSIGYRLPQRRGVISLAVKNLFDSDFRYQDDSYREFRDEPVIGPYFPERIVMARFTAGF